MAQENISARKIRVYLDNCAYNRPYDERDQFDYTKWQRQHFDAKTPEQISAEAGAYVSKHPYTGDASTII